MYRVSTNTLGNLAIELELQYCGRRGPIYPATLRNGKKNVGRTYLSTHSDYNWKKENIRS